MDTLPARSRTSITKQDLWHQHHVFDSPSADIQHKYATRYSTTHTHKPHTTAASQSSSAARSLASTSPFHTDQPSGATRNHAYTQFLALPPTASAYTEHYPRGGSAACTMPAQYERHDRLPAITFPSPISTADAYYHDDMTHRPTAFVASNRFAFTKHPTAITHQTTTHAAYIGTRPTSAPSPYHQPPATTELNGYTRNSAFSYVAEFEYNNARARCRDGRFESEYDRHINHSSHLAETERVRRAEGVLPVSKQAADEHSGFTRRMSSPPCEGVGTEHAGLRVFAGVAGRDHRAGSGWEEKQQVEMDTTGPAYDSSVPCVANGGLGSLYSTTSQRHFKAVPQSPTSAVQSAIHSGYTHNSHLAPATAKLNGQPHVPNAPHGRAISAATANTLATDGRPSHADYGTPDNKRVAAVGPVTRSHAATAYSRENATHVLSADRQERRWERQADGKFVLQPQSIERLEWVHPTVREMAAVQLSEKRGNVKNYGADLDVFDRDWVADEPEEKQSS